LGDAGTHALPPLSAKRASATLAGALGRRGKCVLYAGTAVLALLFVGCASISVNSYVGRDVSFTQYRSYAWAATDRLSTGDPRLDNNPFFQQRLQSDVEKHLNARGFVKGESGNPDLMVHYHASVSQQVDVNGVDTEFGYCERGACQPSVYEAGTIVVDLVDARTNTLVWRGWAKDSLDGAIDNQDWLEQKVDNAVARIMERLPREVVQGTR
jgi:hypothetical protein